jgi:hypothetical protein
MVFEIIRPRVRVWRCLKCDDEVLAGLLDGVLSRDAPAEHGWAYVGGWTGAGFPAVLCPSCVRAKDRLLIANGFAIPVVD